MIDTTTIGVRILEYLGSDWEYQFTVKLQSSGEEISNHTATKDATVIKNLYPFTMYKIELQIRNGTEYWSYPFSRKIRTHEEGIIYLFQ